MSEASVGGCSFIRVDVPECDGKPAFTKFYGNDAIYSMTPCSEEAARVALNHIRTAPVSVWMPESACVSRGRLNVPLAYFSESHGQFFVYDDDRFI